MIDKKDPPQKTGADNSPEEDPIIELTDEVIMKPEEDAKSPSPKTDGDIAPQVDNGPSSGDDDEIIVFEENAKTSLQEDLFTEEDEIDFFPDDNVDSADNGVLDMSSEASQAFGKEDNTIDIDMLADNEIEEQADEEIIPLAEWNDDSVKTDEDIIEVTEFDQHFADDDENLAHASLFDPAGLDDDDFLELFDVEDEGPSEDEEDRELSDSEEKAVEAELSRFFEDTTEDINPNGYQTPPPAGQFAETDKTAASFPADRYDNRVHRPEDSAKLHKGDAAVVSAEQVDQAIERIIGEKLAGRIENIIYQIIEKAVKGEIDRLKDALLKAGPPEDDI